MQFSRFLAIAALFASVFSGASSSAPPTEDYPQLLDAVWSTVNEHFYDPHFKGVDWAEVGARYRQRAGAVDSDAEFHALAAGMLAEIDSSHLHIAAPKRNPRSAGIAASVVTIDGVPVIADLPTLSDARRQGLRPGDRLMSPPETLEGELGSIAEFGIQRCDGTQARVRVRRERPHWPPVHPDFHWSQLRVGAETTVGYLRITRFDNGAAELADQAMAQLMDSQALIIDIRNNSGGNVSALRLASYFGDGAEPAVIILARPYLEALGRPVRQSDVAAAPRIDAAYTGEEVFAAMSEHGGAAAFWTEHNPQRFERPVFVLIGENTGSAAEGFAWYMRERTHAVLIGHDTAGALLSSERFAVGDGWTVTVPVHGLWGPDGTDYGDRAVPPHEAVAWTRDDFCNGRDPDLEKALSLAVGSVN